MTEINGLRLAYRGLVAGLAAGYAWLAVTLIAAAASGDPLATQARFVGSFLPQAPGREETIVVGLAVAQVAGGAFGMLFAYFVGRFFTVRPTLAVAAPCLAVLVWLPVASAMGPQLPTHLPLLAAAVVYGVALGQHLPLRAEVRRGAYAGGSPST